MSGSRTERELLDEQIAYYDRRAPEYDVTSSPDGDPFAADTDVIRAELRALAPLGRVLEIAAGTGQWTGQLAELADELTALDASPQMLRLNAEKVGDERVRYMEADVFAIPPRPAYDLVFFGFWLSHVPPASFDEFWQRVAGWLVPGGRVFFVDERRHRLWREEHFDEPTVVRRRLLDGSEHRLVKVLWSGRELQDALRHRAWRVDVSEVGPFYWGTGSPPPSEA
jgi:demethylmenaquinone methyltransferase/2-methoxy-6-polyprenyl-1,4-benzoquinol methylase